MPGLRSYRFGHARRSYSIEDASWRSYKLEVSRTGPYGLEFLIARWGDSPWNIESSWIWSRFLILPYWGLMSSKFSSPEVLWLRVDLGPFLVKKANFFEAHSLLMVKKSKNIPWLLGTSIHVLAVEGSIILCGHGSLDRLTRYIIFLLKLSLGLVLISPRRWSPRGIPPSIQGGLKRSLEYLLSPP